MKIFHPFVALMASGSMTSTALGERPEDPALLEKALELHGSFLTLDSHIDTPAVMQRPGFDITRRHSWEEHMSQVDFPRLREGGMDGGFLVVFVPQGARTPIGRAEAITLARSRFDTIEAMLAKHADTAGLARTPGEAEYLRKQGKFAFFIGIENGHAIGNDLDVLREYHRRGARYFGISHMLNNDLADSSTDPKGSEHAGLSHLGRAAVELCNELGIMIDVSHTADSTIHEILRISKAPIIASHSGVQARHPHPRNLNDALLLEIARGGGVVQINMFSAYLMDVAIEPARKDAIDGWRAAYRDKWNTLSDEEKTASVSERIRIEREFPLALSDVSTVVDHVYHAVKVMGIDHVGLSADFDGGGGVAGVMDIAGMPRVTAELLRRGYDEEDLRKLWGANLMRVLTQASRTSKQIGMSKAATRMIPLDTEKGRALLDERSATDYAPLAANWVAQLKSHCGAASAVVVLNSLLPGGGFTQDNLFNEETSTIIRQETVYQIGFTLEELTSMIHKRSGLETRRFHAGARDGGYDAWIEALKSNRKDPRQRIIINYPTGWLQDRRNTGGHFSPIADYNAARNLVLIQEINSSRPVFWADARDVWDAMNQIDKVSGLARGWMVVSNRE